MKYIFRYALLSIVLVLATPVVAETLDDGFKAYVDEDYATALRIFRPLAEQRDADAQTYLGYMYSNGLGVTQDYILAHTWLNLAAANLTDEKLRNEAAKLRDTVAGMMTPEQIAEAQRLAREWEQK